MKIKDVIDQVEKKFEKEFENILIQTNDGNFEHPDRLKSFIFSTYTKDLLQSVMEVREQEWERVWQEFEIFFDGHWGWNLPAENPIEINMLVPSSHAVKEYIKPFFRERFINSSSLSEVIKKL